MRPRALRAAVPVAVPCAVLCAVLAGCGGGGVGGGKSNGVDAKRPQAIVEAAQRAGNEASAVHVSGTIAASGMPVTLDLRLVAGKGGSGTVSEGGLSFELIRVGNAAYIKGSEAFYKRFGGSAMAQLLKDKWLKAPTTAEQFATLGAITDIRSLFAQTLSSHGPLQRRTVTTVRGREVVPVVDLTRGGTLYVATTGKPYPVELTKSGSTGGTLTFDRWNEPITLTAPSNAVDITKLAPGG
ncbi:MAG: hypothetical protein FWD42_04935 [Solirubrobacterales bacterium]|nr:hypothetical protein [Solirubrobacterales bacterium]